MSLITCIRRRLRLSATELAVAAVLVLAVVNALAEFWAWLGTPPG